MSEQKCMKVKLVDLPLPQLLKHRCLWGNDSAFDAPYVKSRTGHWIINPINIQIHVSYTPAIAWTFVVTLLLWEKNPMNLTYFYIRKLGSYRWFTRNVNTTTASRSSPTAHLPPTCCPYSAILISVSFLLFVCTWDLILKIRNVLLKKFLQKSETGSVLTSCNLMLLFCRRLAFP